MYRYLRGGVLTNIPLPTFNVINGGRYPQLTQPFNEFMLAPWKADSVEELSLIHIWKIFTGGIRMPSA